ncbi:MAG: signal transduction histidine kinase, LytS [Candidatus Sulfotelmatobacter sp.]|nr:signal transduction histidine kinase, LytS [Candidatus Sulfotelmatobacter sp.]
MPTALTRSEQPRWPWIAAIWSGIGLFDATQTVFVMRAEGMHHAWSHLFISLLLSWLPWALATPLVLRLSRHYPPAHWRRFSTWGAHIGACAVIGLVYGGWIASLEELLNPWAQSPGPDLFMPLWLHKFYNNLLSDLILYGVILLVSYMLDSRERLATHRTETARLNEQLSKAQLNALRRQIEPHFLFNTLNAIAGLVREKRNDAAVNMIAGLSDFLRRVVQDSERQRVPLVEELEFAQKYLDIEKVRFAERLQISVDVPGDLFPAQVPSLILQPMVENAVKHGIAKRVQGGAIRIAASRSNGKITLSVHNNGPSLPAEWEQTQSGVGMSNVRTRLQGLYGSEFELSLKNDAAGGVTASVSIPFTSARPGE